MKKVIAKVAAYELAMSDGFRNSVKKRIKKCEECDKYKSYMNFTKESLQSALDYYGGYGLAYCGIGRTVIEEFDKEFEVVLYKALEYSLEKFGIYTRAEGDKLYVRQSIVELA